MDKRKHKDIKDLLNDRKSGSLDDFEKEALEGFDTLGSEQEALDLKAELDKEISAKQLFIAQVKPTGLKVYWYAAAGLLLAIGFTIYFVSSGGMLDKEPGVAQSTTTLSEKNTAPEGMLQQQPETGKDELTVSPAPPTEPPVVQEEKAAARSAEKQTAGKVIVPAAEAEVLDDRTSQEDNVVTLGKSQNQNPVRIQEEADLDNRKSNVNQKTTSDEKVKDSETALNDRNEGKGSNVPATVAPNAEKSVKKEAKGKAKLKESSTSTESAPAPAESANTGAYGYDAAKNKDAPKKAADTKTDKQDEPGEKLASDVSESKINICFYVGGDDQLKKDLTEKLAEKKISKKFDVILFINKSKKVSDLKFTNTYDLNGSEREAVEKILIGLKNFSYIIKPQPTHQYKLEYRP